MWVRIWFKKKQPINFIYIEAPIWRAKALIYKRYKMLPSDYSLDTYDTFEEAIELHSKIEDKEYLVIDVDSSHIV